MQRLSIEVYTTKGTELVCVLKIGKGKGKGKGKRKGKKRKGNKKEERKKFQGRSTKPLLRAK